MLQNRACSIESAITTKNARKITILTTGEWKLELELEPEGGLEPELGLWLEPEPEPEPELGFAQRVCASCLHASTFGIMLQSRQL